MGFTAPIPIRARTGNWEPPTEADIERCMKESREWMMDRLRDLKAQVPHGKREALLKAWWDTMKQSAFAMESAVICRRKVLEVVRAAARAVGSYEDAPTIDDFFVQEYVYPETKLVCDYIRNRELRGALSLTDARNRGVALTPERTEMLVEMMQRAVAATGLEEASFNFDATFGHLDSPPCWHPKSHDELLRAVGPKKKPMRRASAWGTYVVAWLLGSETLAVKWWNMLVSPAEARWGSVAKYADAKSRLLDDLITLTPRKSPFEPSPRIDSLTEMSIEIAFGWRS